MSDIKKAIRELVLTSNMLDQAHKDALDAKLREQKMAKRYQEHSEAITKMAEVEMTYIVNLPQGATAVTVRRHDEGNSFTVDVLSVEEA